MNKAHHYTAKDFHRYFKDEMTVEEMHALEKAALEDPFLQDALEGYEFTQTAENDVNSLKETIEKKSKKKNNIFPLLKYAAIAIVIVTIGYFAIINSASKNDNNENVTTLAENQFTQQKHENNSAINKTEQSVLSDGNNQSPIKEKKSNINILQSQRQEEKVASINSKLETNDTSFFRKTEDTSYIQSSSPAASPKMMNIKNEAFATLRKNSRTDTLQQSEMLSVSSNSSNAEKLKEDNYNIVKENSKVAARSVKESEVAKKSNAYKFIQTEKNRAVPIIGQQNLEQVINDRSKNSVIDLKGTITFSFEINLAGEPIQLNLEDKTCLNCEEEAKKILQSSTKWTYSPQRVWYSIVFK